MGMQGPLTAQALGRSPYDDTVDWASDADNELQQQYDHRGRPVNPETKRINRDIIRSHNEVMLVIGVAEPENPNAGPEAESERRHEAHEEVIGLRLAAAAKRCIETAGVFGIHGLRQRILIYKRYSEIPFWELYKQAKGDFSMSRDIFPGVPTAMLSNYAERYIGRLWFGQRDKMVARHFVHEIWSYIRVHLELFVATQRLGLIPQSQWFPNPSYFIPFSAQSPIPAPPPPKDFYPGSLLQWLGGMFISATPFLVWVMTQRLIRDWKPQIWAQIFQYLPNTVFNGRKIPALPPPPPPPSNRQSEQPSESTATRPREQADDVSPLRAVDGQLPQDTGPVEAVRRPSIFSARGDDYASDEDDNEGVSRTLISFDVEATESSDAPPGLWSAELRPSVGNDPRQTDADKPVYLDTMLTQLPALIASHIFTNSVSAILTAPYEAMALRLMARTLRAQSGLSCWDIHNVNLFSGLSLTLVTNFLGVELLHLVISGEMWAAFTSLSQYYHQSEEEWKASQKE